MLDLDAIFVAGNFSRDHEALLGALEMTADASHGSVRTPCSMVSLRDLRGPAIGYWNGWTFLLHPHGAFSLLPNDNDTLSDSAARLSDLSPESFAFWVRSASKTSSFGLLRSGAWVRRRSFGGASIDAGRALPVEHRRDDWDFESWPRGVTTALLGTDGLTLLRSDILTVTHHAPW